MLHANGFVRDPVPSRQQDSLSYINCKVESINHAWNILESNQWLQANGSYKLELSESVPASWVPMVPPLRSRVDGKPPGSAWQHSSLHGAHGLLVEVD